MSRYFVLLTCLVLFGFISRSYRTTPNADGSRRPPDNSPAKNYASYCSGCHGEKMNAFVDRKWKWGNSNGDLFKTIKFGYPNNGMPGFQKAFTDKQITDLVNYIQKGLQDLKQYEFVQPVKSNIFRTSSITVRLDTVVKGIQVPWSIAFLPNQELLVTERGGSIYRVSKDKKLHAVKGVPTVVAEGQGGMMDLALHPDFPQNHWIYFSYSLGRQTDSGLLTTTAIARAKLENDSLQNLENIFIALPFSRTRHHYGGRLLFDKQHYLYFSVGERGNEKQNPQTLQNDLGKIHRIKDDGTVPDDNPFVHTEGAKPSIYSMGHRNPQGMVLNPFTGALWEHEHGPRGGDEINLMGKGKIYGWPLICYGINYDGTVLTPKTSMPGLEQPLLYWIPSIAPSGMAFVTGNRYKAWRGNLLVGALRYKYLDLCYIQGTKIIRQEKLFKNIGRVRDVRMAPDGYIYISVENPGFVFRITPLTSRSGK